MRLAKFFGVGVVFVMLTVTASERGSVGLVQVDCTVTVKPGESIQRAIDEAQEGAVIHIESYTILCEWNRLTDHMSEE